MSVSRLLLNSAFLLSAASMLSACETMDSMWQKVSSVEMPRFSSAEKAAASDEAMMMAQAVQVPEGDCPSVVIVEDLKSLYQFENSKKPSPESAVSSVAIDDLKAVCTMKGDTVTVDMDVTFAGTLGPKAKLWSTQKPSFAYPYFIAVTTPAGNINAKEVFALTVSYEPDQDTVSQTESLHQVLPMAEGVLPADYELMIGFQLTEDELAYNRSKTAKSIESTAEAAKLAPPSAPPTAAEKANDTAAAAPPVPQQKPESAPAEPAAPAVEAPAETPVTAEPATAPEAAPVVVEPAPAAAAAPAAAPVEPAPVTETPAPAPEEAAAPAPVPVTPATGGMVIEIKPDGSADVQQR